MIPRKVVSFESKGRDLDDGSAHRGSSEEYSIAECLSKTFESSCIVRSAISLRRRITAYVVLCSHMCKCGGCQGMCTLNALQRPVNYCINWLQRAMYPPCRADFLEFSDDFRDKARVGKANIPFPFHCPLVEGGGGWPELAALCGFRTFSGEEVEG